MNFIRMNIKGPPLMFAVNTKQQLDYSPVSTSVSSLIIQFWLALFVEFTV